MKFKIEFRKNALQDLLDIVEWHEKRMPGLGDEFFIAFSNEIKTIEKNPAIFELKYKNVRKAITKRFPYIIYFILELPDKVTIIGILHMKRVPSHLKKRTIK